MNDVADFEKEYRIQLESAVAGAGMPPALLERYSFESCIRKDKDGKKELYLLTRRADEAKALLRITFNYPEEDALAEAKLLGTLNHPAIPKVYDAYEQDGRRYIVREYIAGHSLYEAVRAGGTLSPKDIYGVVLKLCDALDYLHTLTPPVIHRDIKPQNIIVATDGSIRLIDFGIARIYKEGQKHDTAIILSGPYAPPEQYGYDQTSPLTDIYSLGVTMLFMATGHEEKTGLALQIKDKTLRRLIERCIAFDPKARPQSIGDVSRYITRNSGKAKNHQQAILALCLAALVAGSAAPAYFIGRSNGKQEGYISGQRVGYEEGHDEGYEAGYQTGRDDGYGTGYRAGYDEAPTLRLAETPFDPAIGNLPGNSSPTEGGFAVRSEDQIFYISNSDIYSMDPETAETKLLLETSSATSLNYYDGWLYYSVGASSGARIYKVHPVTGERILFSDEVGGLLHIIDGKFYVRNSTDSLRLYQVDPQSGRATKLNDLKSYFYLNIIDGRMYFTFHEDERKLYTCNLDGSDLRVLYEGACEWICSYDNQLFFFHTSQGVVSGLMRMDLASEKIEMVNYTSASFLNVTPVGIFYVHGNGQELVWLSFDGRTQYKILTDKSGNFNIVGEWIFYINRDDDEALWRVRIDGTENQRCNGN